MKKGYFLRCIRKALFLYLKCILRKIFFISGKDVRKKFGFYTNTIERLKGMKKIISCILTVLMLFMCTSSPVWAEEVQSDVTGENKKTVIGVSVYDLDDAEVRAFRNYFENYAGVSFEVEFLYSSSINTAEEEIDFINELHKRNVKGIISFLSSDLEEVLPVCKEYGMYYVRGSGTISDEMYEKVKDNPYFLGTIGTSVETEMDAAANMAEYFVSEDQNNQNHYIIACGGSAIGNEMHRLRTIGILNKLQEAYGLSYEKSVEELVNTQDTEEIETGSDIKITLVPGYPKDHLDEKLADSLNTGEYNVILSVVSASDFIKIIDAYEEENSTDVLLGSIDCFTEDTYEMFNKKGYNGKERIDYLVGKYGAIVAPSFVAMKNALEGFAEDYREDGSAFRLQQSFWTADSVDEFNKQYALSIGMYDNTYSVEDMMEVLKSYTPETNFEKFRKFTEK